MNILPYVRPRREFRASMVRQALSKEAYDILVLTPH